MNRMIRVSVYFMGYIENIDSILVPIFCTFIRNHSDKNIESN